MSLTVKPKRGSKGQNRRCQVCGDRASVGFYYNALTCMSCKIFFLRNATKDQLVICPKGENCPIDLTTRKNCTKCRLNKCFLVGMRPIRGKVSDTFASFINQSEQRNPTDLRIDAKKHRDPIMRMAIELLDQEEEEDDDLGLFDNLFEDKTLFLSPRPRDPVELTLAEWAMIGETQNALAVFEDENQLPLVGEVQSLIHAFNLTGLYIRRIIKFCKNIPAFKSLSQQDQLIILKQFYFEIILVRCAYQYDMQRDGYRVLENENGTQALFHKVEILKIITNPDYLDGKIRIFARSFKEAMEDDTVIRDLVIAQLLFNPHMRKDLSCPELIRYQYYRYCHLLKRYLEHKFKSIPAANQRYVALTKEINFIGVIKDIKRSIFEDRFEEFHYKKLTQILVEVFSFE